ncbi:hypothetical protein M2373_004557 [Chryseobacterium sp. JUb7]|nr:hypothetical protein [Chryseobacterium sp. JUb7]
MGKVVDFDYDNSEVQDVWACQWQVRIGDFMPNQPDFWWRIKTDDNLSGIISNISDNIQNIILPEIDKRLTDDDLMNSLIKGDFTWSTSVDKFKYLTTFLKAKKDYDSLNEVVEKFMQEPDGKKYYNIVKEHLEEINYSK